MIFKGCSVFDGSGSAPFLADVRVDGDLIVEVGAGLSGDQSVDATGLTVMPGLIDCHVHVVMSTLDLVEELGTPFSMQFYLAAKNLETTLRAGFTTVRDAGGADLGVKVAVEQGLIDGPDILISIAILSQTGGHGDLSSVSGTRGEVFPEHPGRPSGMVDGTEEMRKRVRELVRAGADVIKVCASGGVLSPRSSPRHAEFSLAELEVCVEEARRRGVSVMAHAHSPAGIKNALLAGVRSIEHGIFADDECFNLMRERGAWLVPTLVAPLGVLEAADRGEVVSAPMVEKAREVAEAHRAMLAAAVAAGVKVAFGTDSGVMPHGENARELHMMSDSGMSPSDILVSATSNAAALLGLSDRGLLAPGKLADMVFVAGDPFDLGTHADRLRVVIKRGRTVFSRVAGWE